MEEGAPKVAMVITAYNAERFIRECLLCCLGQDYPNFEVVLVDDGSQDRTAEIARGVTDARLRFFQRPRLGRAKALNEAISLAEAEYIAVNDVDDLSFPFRLSCVVRHLMANPDVVLLGTNYLETSVFQPDRLSGPVGDPGQVTGGPCFFTQNRLYRSMPFAHSTVVFRKETWRQVGGYNEALRICLDYDFILRLSDVGQIGLLPRQTVLYFRDPDSYFRTISTSIYLETLMSIKKRFRSTHAIPLWLRLYDLRYLRKLIAL